MIADALCRSGVKRLVVGDATEIGRGDLDYATYYVQDVGKPRDHHVAATARQLNPEVNVFSLGVPLANTSIVVEALTAMLDDDEEDDTSESDDGESHDDDANDSERDTHAPSRRPSSGLRDVVDDDGLDDEMCFHVVFLCGAYPEMAMALNDLCCEFGVQLVYIVPGKNGISGDILSVVPGRSACLQCFEKRKILKISATGVPVEADDNSDRPTYAASLPSTECVLAGIAVQHAFSHLLDAGPICSRVEYDGYLDELDRSGFIAPVHQCPSQYCREQQQHHHLRQ